MGQGTVRGIAAVPVQEASNQVGDQRHEHRLMDWVAPSLRRLPSIAQRADRRAAQGQPAQPPTVMKSSTLCGHKVVSSEGETLGAISDLMVDLDTGGVAYAVMASGGFMGVGERLYAIPWKALDFNAARQCFVLAASRASFADAPSFDRDHWPSAFELQGHERAHRLYATRPEWEQT